MVQWSRAFGGRQFFSAGTDWRWVDGDSEEDGLDAATGTQVTLKRISGGTQRSLGLFVQDVITPMRQPDDDARARGWTSGATTTGTISRRRTRAARRRPTTPRRCPSATTRWSARASPRAITSPRRSACGATSAAGFRAPTLNELYRQFRVGTVLTLANNQLGPERLVGGELGVSYMPCEERHAAHRPGSTTASRIRSRT